MGDCPLKLVDWRSSQSTANPDFSLMRSRKLLRAVSLCFCFCSRNSFYPVDGIGKKPPKPPSGLERSPNFASRLYQSKR
jgi:hypothetical protein